MADQTLAAEIRKRWEINHKWVNNYWADFIPYAHGVRLFGQVYNEKGMPHKVGIGIFARAFMEHFPLIPVEDDGRLHDPIIRENFILQIFTMNRWRDNLAKKKGLGNLVDFHTRNKLLILSHSPKHYRFMGKLVASGKQMPIEELYHHYQLLLVEALRLKTTIRKNSNVLQHLMGYFKKQLTAYEKCKKLLCHFG